MNDRRDQYICAALVRQPYNPNVTPEETAKCIVRLADALLAAAGEQKPAAITQDELLGDANLFAAIFADKRQVAGMIARAEAAESKLAACERERDALKRRLEPLTLQEGGGVNNPIIYGSRPLAWDEITAIVADADRIRSRRQP